MVGKNNSSIPFEQHAELFNKKDLAEKKLAEALAAEKKQADIINALSPSDVTHKRHRQIHQRIKEIHAKYEAELKTINNRIKQLNLDEPHIATESSKQILPTRFARQAEALTAQLVISKNEINALNTRLNALYTKAQAMLSNTQASDKNLTHQYTAREITTLNNDFGLLNTQIIAKLKKQQQGGYTRLWKPIYDLFRELFGKTRELTKLTAQQNLLVPIFMDIGEVVTKQLQLEAQHETLDAGLQNAIQEQKNLKQAVIPIQKELGTHQLGQTSRMFVSEASKSVAFVAKALDRFLTEPTVSKRDILFQMMRDNPHYVKGPKTFLTAIDKAQELYEEIEQADSPLRTPNSSFKEQLADIKLDEETSKAHTSNPDDHSKH